MSDVIYRSFVPDLEIRSAAQGGDGRTIVGLAVPYGRPVKIDAHLTEQFARGAFKAQLRAAARIESGQLVIPFTRNHLAHGGTLIGKATLLRDDPAGLYGEWRISRTEAGDETLELVRDGVLDQLSIGFREGQNRRLKDGTIERVSAELREVSVVLQGAYGELATVSGVRAVSEAMTNLDAARQILAGLPTLPVV